MFIPTEPSPTHSCADWIPSFTVSSHNGLCEHPAFPPAFPPEFLPGVSPRKQPLVAGIIGGIGSGKSAVSRGLSQHFHVLTIDADRIGHEVLTFPAVKDRIRQTFGNEVFDGAEINRTALARHVFGSQSHHQQSLTRLEEIVHPEIRRQLQKQLEQIPEDIEVVILDAAVMLEAGWDDLCDTIVFVDTPFQIRLDRVQKSRGWTADELRRREASQISIEEKRSVSDFTVDNSRSLDDSVRQLAPFLRKLIDQNQRSE